MACRARNCRPATDAGRAYPLSTAQGIKSRPASRCNQNCKQGRTCGCADKPAAMDFISAARLMLLAYALTALSFYFFL